MTLTNLFIYFFRNLGNNSKMAKKKKLKQLGMRRDDSEADKTETDQTVTLSTVPHTDVTAVQGKETPGKNVRQTVVGEMAETKQNGSTPGNKKETIGGETGATKKPFEEPAGSSSMPGGSVRKGVDVKGTVGKLSSGLSGCSNEGIPLNPSKKPGISGEKSQEVKKLGQSDQRKGASGKVTRALIKDASATKLERKKGGKKIEEKVEQRMSMKKKKIKDPRLIPRMKEVY